MGKNITRVIKLEVRIGRVVILKLAIRNLELQTVFEIHDTIGLLNKSARLIIKDSEKYKARWFGYWVYRRYHRNTMYRKMKMKQLLLETVKETPVWKGICQPTVKRHSR